MSEERVRGRWKLEEVERKNTWYTYARMDTRAICHSVGNCENDAL